MIQDGQIVLFEFPQTDQATGKLRPALVLRSLPGSYDDWLICMISTRLAHEIPSIDEIISADDLDFPQTGLKTTSLIRVTRLATGLCRQYIRRTPTAHAFTSCRLHSKWRKIGSERP